VRFVADMCMDVRVVTWLNSQGHDATHLRDQGLQRLPNGEIFDKAIAESRVVVTFDLDFGEIVALCKGRKAGVILFRLRNTRTAFVIQRLSTVISECADALTRGAIVIVEETRHRVREFP
jgi:predicted nuclease of predicted toxin-antitoxin system